MSCNIFFNGASRNCIFTLHEKGEHAMIKKQLKKLTGVVAVCAASSAWAVPYIDGPYGQLVPGGTSDGVSKLDPNVLATTLFTGSEVDNDETVIYYPYSKLEIVKDDQGVEKFSFAYGHKGAIMTATLRATIDRQAVVATARAIKRAMEANGVPGAENARLAPIPVHKGTYRSVLRSIGTGQEFIIASTEVENSIPTNEVALSVSMGRAAADLVAISLQNAYTVVGWNYTYDFPGRTTPYRATITLHWESILNYMRQQFGFRTIASSLDIDKTVRKLTERKDIVIKVVQGDEGKVWDQVVQDVVRIVLARTFKAHHPEPNTQKLEVPPQQSGFISGVMGMASQVGGPSYSGWNTGVSAAYSLVDVDSSEYIDETFDITSHPYRIFTASAGVQIPGNCQTHADHYAHQDYTPEPGTGAWKIIRGCPPKIYPETLPALQGIGPKPGSGAADRGGANLGRPSNAPATPPSMNDDELNNALNNGL
jgi:hypothetical protein